MNTESEQLAIDLVEGNADPEVHSEHRSGEIAVSCKSVEEHPFILIELPRVSNSSKVAYIEIITDFEFDHFEFKEIEYNGEIFGDCFICSTAGSDSYWSHQGQEVPAHNDCAEAVNKCLREVKKDIQQMESKLNSELLSWNM